MTNIILFGPPGSGKGTQAKMLAEKFNLVHISTGDLFRYELSNDTPLGKLAKSYMEKGELVPDEVTISMLKAKMERHPDAQGFIFDGFPRTIPQADALVELLNESGQQVDQLIALKVGEDEIVQRILLRGQASGRVDDQNEEIIRNRINVYNQETQIVYEYFDAKGNACSINGIGSIEEIFDMLSGVMQQLV
jgi:adenylate kinase